MGLQILFSLYYYYQLTSRKVNCLESSMKDFIYLTLQFWKVDSSKTKDNFCNHSESLRATCLVLLCFDSMQILLVNSSYCVTCTKNKFSSYLTMVNILFGKVLKRYGIFTPHFPHPQPPNLDRTVGDKMRCRPEIFFFSVPWWHSRQLGWYVCLY